MGPGAIIKVDQRSFKKSSGACPWILFSIKWFHFSKSNLHLCLQAAVPKQKQVEAKGEKKKKKSCPVKIFIFFTGFEVVPNHKRLNGRNNELSIWVSTSQWNQSPRKNLYTKRLTNSALQGCQLWPHSIYGFFQCSLNSHDCPHYGGPIWHPLNHLSPMLKAFQGFGKMGLLLILEFGLLIKIYT